MQDETVQHIPMIHRCYRETLSCRACFKADSKLKESTIAGPQPRWVGKDYFSQAKRVLFVLKNPGAAGAGNPKTSRQHLNQTDDREMKRCIEEYAKGTQDLESVLKLQRKHWPAWGNRRGDKSRCSRIRSSGR